MPQSVGEYIDNGGNCCPHCDSEDVDGRQPFESDIGVAWQKMQCNTCGAIWDDDYNLVGYHNLKTREDAR